MRLIALIFICFAFLFGCRDENNQVSYEFQICSSMDYDEAVLDSMAYSILKDLNYFSKRDNKEYGLPIYITNKGIQYGDITIGDSNSVNVTYWTNLECFVEVIAIAHTHAEYDPKYNSENFSTVDTADVTVTQYLMTPNNNFFKFNIDDRKVYWYIDGLWLRK